MAEKTEIAWCDSTFNPVIGCQKVTMACDHCYAETLMDTRYHRVVWGQRKTETTEPSVGTRIRTSPAYWRQPHLWNKRAAEFQAKHGHRQRVFCASLSDVFDNQWNPQWRSDLFRMIDETLELDWLLLTKRPENISRMLKGFPMPNVWLGTTAEDQENYDRRWSILQRIPARVRFISYEPALSDIWLHGDVMPNWIICGGESGPGYRQMKTEWAAHMAIQCEALGIAFFLKQMSGKKPIPHDLMIREFPEPRR